MKLKHLLAMAAVFSFSMITGVSAQAASQVTIKTELASPIVLEKSQDTNYLRISLTGFPMEAQKRSPINLALVIDRSSSMGGERIQRAREAAIMTVNMLQENDTLSIVAYDSDVEVIVPATRVTNKQKLIDLINQKVTSRGWTALFAGLSKSIDQVERHLDKEHINRVILLSDGQANVGPTSVNELSGLSRIAAKKGIAITTVGIGDGYNEDLMTAIAGYSDGNHFFVNQVADLEKVFANEFQDVMSVVAQDVEITIKIADGVKPVRLLGRDGEIVGNTVKVRLNQLYSNQEKYILLEVIPASGAANEQKNLAEVQVRYDNLSTKKQDDFKQNVSVSYTASADVAKNAVIEDVLVESAIQRAALENERAIELMDQGKADEAKEVLAQNAADMSKTSNMLRSEDAKGKAQANADLNRELLGSMSNSSWTESRKVITESNYQIRNQQKSVD
ncbi:MAG: vWA domain-containing protein [Saezia sp.]